MSILDKETLFLLQECANFDTITESEDCTEELNEFFSGLPEMNIPFIRRVEDVPVMVDESATGREHFVEFDDALKIAEYNDCSLKEAMTMIFNVNEGMNLHNTYLVLDEKCQTLKEVSGKSKESKAKIKKTVDKIKEDKIKVVTGKSKGKKCKKCGKNPCECKK